MWKSRLKHTCIQMIDNPAPPPPHTHTHTLTHTCTNGLMPGNMQGSFQDCSTLRKPMNSMYRSKYGHHYLIKDVNTANYNPGSDVSSTVQSYVTDIMNT